MNPHYPAVAARAAHRCEYCHAPEAIFNFPFEVEHIIPDRRGTHDPSNLALSCRACNIFKSNLVEGTDHESQAVVRLFDPRHDSWVEHFRVGAESGSIAGITPIGRATVDRLNMNSRTQCRARLQWFRLGLFP